MATVAIAGGGLAGLTCARDLVAGGHTVRVYEAMPFLGGRAATWLDADGEWVEQGLHVFLGEYSEFQRLLRDIGQDPNSILFWMNEVRLQDPAGPQAVYGINPLEAPLQTLGSLLGQNRYLGPLDKLSLVPLLAPALASLETLRKDYDGMNVAEWWRRLGGSDDVLERLLRPLCRAIQFTDAEHFSAYNFLGWVHHVAANIPNNRLGGYVGARDETIFRPLGAWLNEHGAEIQTGARLKEILWDDPRRRLAGFELDSGERVEADHYVVAIPAWEFAPLIPGPLRDAPFFQSISALPVAPAISVQIWFDRQVVEDSGFRLVARSRACVYQDQSRCTYRYDGSRISAIVSPADDLLEWTDERLVERTLAALGAVQPAVRDAHRVKSVVLKHRRHLIRPLPGAMSARPTQRTPVDNLFLAGDWTQQDFFGSQEGAVRGGRACAAAILRSLEAQPAAPRPLEAAMP